jgi:hypothetical protein
MIYLLIDNQFGNNNLNHHYYYYKQKQQLFILHKYQKLKKK